MAENKSSINTHIPLFILEETTQPKAVCLVEPLGMNRADSASMAYTWKEEAGVENVYRIRKLTAVAAGMGIDVLSPDAKMVVCMEEQRTEIGVLALGGYSAQQSLPTDMVAITTGIKEMLAGLAPEVAADIFRDGIKVSCPPVTAVLLQKELSKCLDHGVTVTGTTAPLHELIDQGAQQLLAEYASFPFLVSC